VSVRELESYAQEHGLWTEQQAADDLRLPRESVWRAVKNKQLAVAEYWAGTPFTATLFEPAEVKRYERWRYESGDKRMIRDPAAMKQASLDGSFRVGNGPLEMLELAREAERKCVERNARAAKNRVGTGRSKCEYHHDWAAQFVKLKAEQLETHEWNHVPGDPPPTNLSVALLIAEDDFEQHPERWTYSPFDSPAEAELRVWMAVKPLLSPLKKLTHP
jgi:hypothetical protein